MSPFIPRAKIESSNKGGASGHLGLKLNISGSQAVNLGFTHYEIIKLGLQRITVEIPK